MKNIVAVVIFMLVGFCVIAQPVKRKSVRKAPVVLQDVKSKEIKFEYPCDPAATIYIENIFRRITILTTNENKVRLETTVFYQGNPAFSDEEWLTKLDLKVSGTPTNVVVKSVAPLVRTAQKKMTEQPVKRAPDTVIARGVAVFDSMGEWVNKKTNIRRDLKLFIPAGVRLDIDSRYADVMLDNDIKYLKLKLANGTLTMKNAGTLIVNSQYGNVYANDINNADIDISNARFKARNIPRMIVHSVSSFLELITVRELIATSLNDNYDVEELEIFSAQKEYGDLRVTLLKRSFALSGKNADVRIRNIDPGVQVIKIDNQYADLRLPVATLQNYKVNFTGNAGMVYAGFDRNKTSETAFNAVVGNPQANPTSFELKCDNCTVDFK